MRRLPVVVIPGDGIGPELTDVAIEVLEAVEKRGDFALALDRHVAGAALYRETGRAMTDATLEACRNAAAILKGPVGDPVDRALGDGAITLRPDGTVTGGTRAAGRAVVDRLP